MNAIVDAYIRDKEERELEYYGRFLRTDEEAVREAALGRSPIGKRHSHQRSRPRAALEDNARRLVENLPRLRGATTFDELLRVIEDLIMPIDHIGKLTAYDTAVRTGARFGLEPAKVYLHAGTREGAVVLGFDRSQPVIEMHELTGRRPATGARR